MALAFSGGGFRATLSALGVLRFMLDAGLGPQIRYVSSVSGGSVANGLFACSYPAVRDAGFSVETLDDTVILPLLRTITSRSLKLHLLENIWQCVGPNTRTTLLAKTFDSWFFHGRLLEALSTEVRFIFNASNLSTGVRFGFERDEVGDWVMGQIPTSGTGLHVAEAVAASAAVPGAFAPVVLKGLDFPCADGRVPMLLDGGAYDNMGLQPLDDLYRAPHGPAHQGEGVCIVALNAGGVFRTGAYGRIPLIRDLQRANSLLYRQTTALRMSEMVERFQAWEQGGPAAPPAWGRFGVLFGLATTLKDPTSEWIEARPEHPEWRLDLAEVRTSFAKFRRRTCARLLYRGWWLAGATLSRFHRDLLPPALPTWRAIDGIELT